MRAERRIGIIGFGQFGQFWARALKADHEVLVTDTRPLSQQAAEIGASFLALPDLCRRADTLFLCVPINLLDTVVRGLRPHLQPGTLVFDTCSVKVHPARILQQHLADLPQIELVASHPMFGPDSGAQGLQGLVMMLWPLQVSDQTYREWYGYFEGRGLRVVEMPPEEHDRLAATSQGVTHYIGRVLGELDLSETPIDTTGFQILRSVVQQTCNDTWELFHDLQTFNPYTKDMQLQLEYALDKVYSKLLPERASAEQLVIGVQGGQGSFSEAACRHYCVTHDIVDFRVEYLYTSENVLSALHQGLIDRGIFVIQNAKGGVVMESVHALSRFTCEIIDTFDIVIDHCILHRPDVRFEQVERLMSHPHALAQCAGTLREKYPHLERVSGEGDQVDQALCARLLSEGKLPKTTAVLASASCADLYGLVIHDRGLQDLGAENPTTFMFVQRQRYFHRPEYPDEVENQDDP